MSLRLAADEIPTALAQGEGQFREFKSAWDRSSGLRKKLNWKRIRDKIADVVAAFANADGGLLFVGVEDDGRPSGHGYSDDDVRGLLATPENRLQPPVRCRTERVEIDGKELLVFEVSQSAEAIMVVANGFPYRVGTEILREPQELINQRKQALRVVGYEQRFRPEATLDHLDMELARRFLRRTPVGARPVKEALEYYGLVERHVDEWRITNAGLLLFARRPALKWHPRAGVRVFRVEGREQVPGRGRNVTQIGRADPPLALALDEALSLTRSQVRQSERLNGPLLRGSTGVSGLRVAGGAGQRDRPSRLRGHEPGNRGLVLRGSRGDIQSRRPARPRDAGSPPGGRTRSRDAEPDACQGAGRRRRDAG